MDKLLRDMDALCQTTAREREERYRVSCRMARISEILLSGNEIVCDGGAGVRIPIETGWKEQQLTDEEMDKLRVCHDKTCDETFDEILRNMINELQDMMELFESMEKVEDCSIDDTLLALEANILAYNFTRDMGDYDG